MDKIKFCSLKDPVTIENQRGIYLIPCFCSSDYIDQTNIALKFRLNEIRDAFQIKKSLNLLLPLIVRL